METTRLMRCASCGSTQLQVVGKDAMVLVDAPTSSVSRFVAERCRVGPSLRSRTVDVVAAYRQWAAEIGEQEMSNKAFGLALRDVAPVVPQRSNGSKYYRGIGLLSAICWRHGVSPSS